MIPTWLIILRIINVILVIITLIFAILGIAKSFVAKEYKDKRNARRLIMWGVIVFGAYLVSSTFGGYWYNKITREKLQEFQKNKKQSIQQEIQQQEQVQKYSAQYETADWQIYRNEDYGFQLTFSDDWKGYRTVEKIYGKGVIFSFEMPTDNKLWEYGSGYVSMFSVSAIPASDWWGNPGESMAHNDKYYFLGVLSSNAPRGFRAPTSYPLSTFKLIE